MSTSPEKALGNKVKKRETDSSRCAAAWCVLIVYIHDKDDVEFSPKCFAASSRGWTASLARLSP
jgi:hypothetical protein